MTTTPQAAQVLTDLIIEHLTSAYACTRVWSAWQVGTMSENDFVPLSETDFAQDLAQDILAKLQAATPAEPAQDQLKDHEKDCQTCARDDHRPYSLICPKCVRMPTGARSNWKAKKAEPAQAAELPDERAAFEQWASDNGEFPRAVARSGDVYHLMATQTYWLAWQARAALSARKPFTNAQIERLFYNSNRGNGCASLAAFVRVVRLVESAHGIGLEVKP